MPLSALAPYLQRWGFREPDYYAQLSNGSYLLKWAEGSIAQWCYVVPTTEGPWRKEIVRNWRDFQQFRSAVPPPSEGFRAALLDGLVEMRILPFCSICGETRREELHINESGEILCKEHYLPATKYCIRCRHWVREWNETWGRCEDCYSREIRTCYMCDSEIDGFHTYEGNYYCETCYHDTFISCYLCGDIVPQDEAQYDDDGYPYCEACFTSRLIRSYNTDVLSVFGRDYIGKKAKDQIYLGVELETEAEGGFQYTLQELKNLVGNFCIFKKDGSLSEDGIEIVSLPATLSSHKELWEKFFHNLPDDLTSWSNGRCGLHIHISRKPLGMLRIGKMVVFLNDPKNAELIAQIAGRYGNDYCLPKKKTITQVEGEERYEMLNLLNHNTVEMRIFKGTLNRGHFYADLEFADSLVRFCGKESIRRINKDSYLEFLYKNAKEYPFLVRFLKRRDLTSMDIFDEGEI